MTNHGIRALWDALPKLDGVEFGVEQPDPVIWPDGSVVYATKGAVTVSYRFQADADMRQLVRELHWAIRVAVRLPKPPGVLLSIVR